MKKQITISIGIPAYNEENNIAYLLRFLLEQQIQGAMVKEIIVVSDGSTDTTVKQVKSVKNGLIKVIVNNKRSGQNAVQNLILRKVQSDILILLNADVIPTDKQLIQHLIDPILQNRRVGLVGGNTVPATAKTWVEWAVSAGHLMKQVLFIRLKEANNIYLCHGRVRAFRKELYQSLTFPLDCPEDAYSFLWCKKKGFSFRFESRAEVVFRSPQTIKEHAKQSMRFTLGKEHLIQHFGMKKIQQVYAIPKNMSLRVLLYYGIRHPVSITTYVMITIVTRVFYKLNKSEVKKWDIAVSSKQVVYE